MKSYKINCILLVDDDEVAGWLGKDTLEELNIAEKIEVLSNGKNTLEYLKSSIPELIFIDMRMPGMDGLDLIKEIRRKPENNEIQIIGLSSHFSSSDKIELKELEVLIIHKPLTKEKILHCINNNEIRFR